MRGLTCLAVVAAAFVFAGGAAAASLTSVEKSALEKLEHAPLSPTTKTSARGEIARAAHLVRTLPNGRGYHILVSLQDAASFPAALTEPRALALYGALRANDDYFAAHWAPADHTDIVGADGVVYRYFAGYSFRFHPLANFAALNVHVAESDIAGTEALADALIARGVYQRGGGIAWEYDFPFQGGRAPWLSGMAQAVAAQAFAGAATLVTTRTTAYMREAGAAYNFIPRHLMTSVAAGPWIRLYSFGGLVVLNADLQATLSLQSYASTSGDASAAALATRMENAAYATLPKFDTGYWSYYALPHEPSPVDYHVYVGQLLTQLAKTDARFADAAKRFISYEHQPPAFQLENAGVGQVRFWLSKPASVRMDTNAGPSKSLALLDGWHTVTWTPKLSGVFPVHVTASDWLGNKTQFDTLPIVHVGGKPTQATKVAEGTTTDTATAPTFVSPARGTVTWPDAATAPDPPTVAAVAGKAFLELDYVTTPTASFAQYAAALLQQAPTVKYLVVGPAPVAATAAQYAQTLAAVRSAVQAVMPGVAVGPLIDGANAPRPTVAALKKAAVAGDVVAFHAASSTDSAAWTQPNLALLTAAFGGTLPPLLLDRPSDAAVTAAACATNVAGIVLDSAPDAAVSAAVRGTVVCPGFAAPAQASDAEFPTTVSSGQPVSMQLGCVRDCLYLVTLVGSDRRAIVATRGTLRGGAAPATVALPKTTLGQPSYTLDVRIVNRINPGPAVTLESPALPAGASS